MDENKLGKEYEDWLDGIEPTLPLPIPEEEHMGRTKLIQQIYDRLARLEDSREVARIAEQDTTLIDGEMKELRLKLQEIMNSVCPLIQEK